MKRRWRELTERPPLPAFYEGALCLRPPGRLPRRPAHLLLPPALCAHLRIALLVPHGRLLPEPVSLYYKEAGGPRAVHAPWHLLGSCWPPTQLDPTSCPEWQLLHGVVEPYARPVTQRMEQ